MKMALPLAGIRVADFSAAWAGPMCTRMLAYLGAEVIKVEGPQRFDPWRGAVAAQGAHSTRFYPDHQPGDHPYNRYALFNTQNHDKKDVSIDLRRPEGVELAKRLVAVSQLVVYNFSPGVMESFGLGYAALRQVQPDIIVVSIPALGETGPKKHFVAWGYNTESLAGQTALQGYPGEAPMLTGYAILDAMGAIHGASACITALLHWRRTGEGQFVEVSQQEAALPVVGEYLLDHLYNGRDHGPRGNRHAFAAPHDAYRCRDGEWVAVAVFDQQQWQALCRVLERPDLPGDERFRLPADRYRHQDLLRPDIEAWTAQRRKQEAAARLQAAGVPAAPVNNTRDLAADPQLAASGFFFPLTHPEAGTHRYPGLPFRHSHTPGQVRAPSPCFGEHNEYVLREVLGLSEAEVGALYASGVVTPAPAGAGSR